MKLMMKAPTSTKDKVDILHPTKYREKIANFINNQPRSKQDLYDFLKTLIKIKIDRNGIVLPKQAIYISNHPRLAKEFHLDTQDLPTQGKLYPSLHFPGIFQAAWHELIAQDTSNDFVTAIRSIGYDTVMEDMDCFVLPEKGGVNAISKYLTENSNKSLVIYPEGKCDKILNFKHGFYHVAKQSNISDIIVCHMTPEPREGQELNVKVLDKIQVPDFGGDEKALLEWIESMRLEIFNYDRKLIQSGL